MPINLLHERKTKMKRKILCVLLVCVMLTSSLALVSCGGGKSEEGTVTRMTVDINPSVEFMIDDENKVVSATALNDDGSIILVGEVFVGKTPEEAVELMLNVATETGYLVKGNATATDNQVKISVTGASKYAEELVDDISAKANEVLSSLDISASIETAEALKLDALRALALSTSIYTEEEINAMDQNQLLAVIAEGRVESAEMLTAELREAYFTAKEHEISFAESEETARIIESIGGLYTVVHTAYKTALDTYGAAITKLDEMRYDMLVSPDSEYQKSLIALREAKADFIEQRAYTATLDINGTEYASATATLALCEDAYDAALAAYEALGDQINASLQAAVVALTEAKAQLDSLEQTLFDDNLEAKLAERAAEIEANLNAKKDAFFAEFEAAHADDIAAIEASLAAKKQELKATVSGEAQ